MLSNLQVILFLICLIVKSFKKVINIVYIMLSNLQVILFLICLIVKSFKKVFMHHLAISNIVVYHIIIILNILFRLANCIKLRVIKSWLI